MLLMVEKAIRGGICHATYLYLKGNNKYTKMKINKNKESSYLKYWDVNNLYGWAIPQKLPVNDFKCVEETSQFNEDFIKICNEDSDTGYFIEADVKYSENCMNLTMTHSFCQKE